ncbi:MAG: hypothetical protein A3F18_07055 [Legionellales bacterium RIFCSPHIGHO2_12_FULL_37_14]|nr:MAG: hypothetical protein A3F18_07055 [Legionellales bacterium RIFCSPHIGHO2_12_FULL_37_14]
MSYKKKGIIDEEKSMISALELGGYAAIENEASEIKRLTKIFRESGSKVKRVNIRMTNRDVEKAKALAMREGIPYATFITRVIHQYLTGQIN